MKYVLKNQEMQDVDKETIQQIGMPGLVLMERASEKIARRLMETVRKSDRILSVAGCGNNGGDALAAARIVLEEGYSVDFTVVGELSKASGDLKTQYDILTRLGYEQKKEIDYNGYDWILEGMFGVGLSREIAGIYRTVVERINESRASRYSLRHQRGYGESPWMRRQGRRYGDVRRAQGRTSALSGKRICGTAVCRKDRFL